MRAIWGMLLLIGAGCESPPNQLVGSETKPDVIDEPDPDAAIQVVSCSEVGNIDPTEVRFLVVGDQGTGDAQQLKVANAMTTKCLSDGCDFAVTLGDNIYPSGVDSVNDKLWNDVFVTPYAALNIPFYPTLGNHDYGSNDDDSRGEVQVAYSQVNDKWIMPGQYYAIELGPVTFVAPSGHLINNSFGTTIADQTAYFEEALAKRNTPWTFSIGHFPYRSNGTHGDAGFNDGVEGKGDTLRQFFEDTLCDASDIHFAGHEHNLQVLPGNEACRGLGVVAGGGGRGLYSLPGSNPYHFQASSYGFAYVRATSTSVCLEILNDEATLLYTHRLTR